MDKNFIKVDDLVRQRLGGGEERERSGAWLNMRDLLDKEMPQEERRIGIFYWRRLFSVVAALSLVGTVAVGSYEFSNAFRNRNVAELGEPGIEAVNNEPTANYVASGTETVVRDEQRVAGRVNGRMSGGLPEKPRHTASASATNTGTEATLNSVSGTVGADGTTTGTITIDGNTHRGADVKRNTTKTYSVKKEVVTKGGALASNDHTGSSESPESRLTATASKAANTVEKTTASQNVVAANNPATDSKVAAGNGAAHTENSNASGNIATVASKTDLTSAGAAGKKSTGTVSKTAGRIGNGKTTHVAPGSQNADLKNGNPVLSSGVASNSVAAGGKKEQSGRSAINALPTVGRGVTTANIPVAGVPTPMPAVTAAEASGAAQKAPVAAPSAQSVEANVPKDESSVAINDAAAVRNDPPLKDARSEANNSQGKKVITKLLVHTRNIKIAENEYAVKEDTISMEKVNMDLGLAGTQPAPSSTDMSATVSGKRASKRAMAGRGRSAVTTTGSAATNTSAGVSGVNTTGGAAGKSGAGKQGSSQSAANGIADEEKELAVAGTSASGSEDGAAKAVNQAIVPASAATEVSKETEVAKGKSAAKQGAGASLVQKMLSAFNDIKQNASRTQFVPGITAGINANFFGPSSFKGFQFGLTGDIIFNEKWNIMTEFKYFHRLNNSTQIDDNFYTYTQVGSQYRKDLQLNSYSFSALHSLELPVSVRYHQGKFDFYAGGNFLYTFSINTGAATQPAVGVAPEFVSTPGNDNAPTLNEADFSSRFGLGYLFGFSYQVAPKFNIDIRNVQTVWDNAASTGARSISNQLYKTPSLQLSIMYRLGGNRNKD